MIEEIADLPQPSNAERVNRINVIQGDLLGQNNLDAVVSFLTEDLAWGGPVNQKLIALAGHQLDEYVLSNFVRPKPGEAFSTPAFTLPFKSLIFGVVPMWDSGLSGEERHLKNAVKNILQEAVSAGFSRIGIPALGMGRSDVPLKRGARAIFNGIEDSDLDAFEEIRVVCKTPESFDAYAERARAIGF